MTYQGTPAPTAVPDANFFQIDALVTEQTNAMSRLANLEGRRVSLQSQLQSATGSDAEAMRRQLSATIGEISGEKAKIEQLKAQIAEIARPSAPVTLVPPNPPDVFFNEPRMFGMQKDEVMLIFAFVMMFPIVVTACVRWIQKGRRPVRAAAVLEDDRLARLEQAVESVAIEVERIGESQRFQAKLAAEKQPLAERKF